MRKSLLAALLVLTVLAGCLDDPASDPVAPAQDLTAIPNLVDRALSRADPMAFSEHVVGAAVSYSNDLYEPTLEVDAQGTIYITGHTILVDTTGAPVYRSTDDGESWSQLPFFMGQSMPADLPGATPPPSDEIFLVAGDDGYLYGVDITLAAFPVNAWSDNGAQFAYHNPNAYDEAQVALQAGDCLAAPAKDRPWAAYADGLLLMVSNPAAGPAQIGVLPVPAGPLGLAPTPAGIGALTGGGRWNVCAGVGYHSAGCSIPGIPDMRKDGLFAAPQLCDGALYLMLGNARNVNQIDVKAVFEHSSGGEITSVYGQALFDAAGTLFVGISNNTSPDDNDNRTGQMRFAASTDGGVTFRERVFTTASGAPIVHFYADANKFGPGALVVWAVPGNTTNAAGDVVAWDWFAGHLQVDAFGFPVLDNVYQAIEEGPQPSAHVTGAAVGPDGRAYIAMYESVDPLGTPLSVYVQRSGPTLPVTA